MVSKLLGHAKLETTQKYLHVGEEDMVAAVSRASVVDHLAV
jgi:site-specific recombinase XerD